MERSEFVGDYEIGRFVRRCVSVVVSVYPSVCVHKLAEICTLTSGF